MRIVKTDHSSKEFGIPGYGKKRKLAEDVGEELDPEGKRRRAEIVERNKRLAKEMEGEEGSDKRRDTGGAVGNVDNGSSPLWCNCDSGAADDRAPSEERLCATAAWT